MVAADFNNDGKSDIVWRDSGANAVLWTMDGVHIASQELMDPIPASSTLAVHHLDAAGKADLFRRVAEALAPGGRFVLADVVVPERPEDAVIPCTPGFDLPDSVPDQLEWLRAAGLEPSVTWARRDLAVLAATRPPRRG